jgi:murein L,D-transpeptidase YcbB/YkuD
VLGGLAGAKTAGEVLGSYLPQHSLYTALKAKLAEARKQKGDHAPARIGAGPVLKTGKVLVEDERVPMLRERLGLAGDKSDITYDKELENAVAKFQKQHGLPTSGTLNGATIEALNGPRRDRDADIIIANLERWRWLPHDIGKTRVVVNIPDYTLRLTRNDQLYWNTRIVVGKPNLPTPIMSATMKFITVNPTWNVPPSIIANEYLPALRSDPDALRRIGLRIEQNPDGTVRIYQPPGDGNALGRIRFNFPNKFLVYQHDTPDKHLFAKEERAFSHGCMRVQNPDQYAATLLNITMPNERYTPEKIRSMYGRSEIDLKFPTPIPVNITYQTAFVDDHGKLQTRKDIYGRDSVMIGLLKNSRNKDLEVMVSHAQPSYGRPSGSSLPAGVNFASDNTYSSGPTSFFERLFGGPSTMTPPAPVGRRPQPRFTR